MDQHSINFHNNEDHPLHRQLDKQQQQALIELMTLVIITVFHTQEKHYDQSQPSNQDQC